MERVRLAKAALRLGQHRKWLAALVSTEQRLRAVAESGSLGGSKGAPVLVQRGEGPPPVNPGPRAADLFADVRHKTQLRAAIGPHRARALLRIIDKSSGNTTTTATSTAATAAATGHSRDRPRSDEAAAAAALVAEEADFASELTHRLLMRKVPVAVSRLERAVCAAVASPRRRRRAGGGGGGAGVGVPLKRGGRPSDQETERLSSPSTSLAPFAEVRGIDGALAPAASRALQKGAQVPMSILSRVLRAHATLEAFRAAFVAEVAMQHVRQYALLSQRKQRIEDELRLRAQQQRQHRRRDSSKKRSRAAAAASDDDDDALRHRQVSIDEAMAQLVEAHCLFAAQPVARPYATRRLWRGVSAALHCVVDPFLPSPTAAGESEGGERTIEASASPTAPLLLPASSVVARGGGGDNSSPTASTAAPSALLRRQAIQCLHSAAELLLALQRHRTSMARATAAATTGDSSSVSCAALAARAPATPDVFAAYPRSIRSAPSRGRRHRSRSPDHTAAPDIPTAMAASKAPPQQGLRLADADAMQLEVLQTLTSSLLPFIARHSCGAAGGAPEFIEGAPALLTLAVSINTLQRAATATLLLNSAAGAHERWVREQHKTLQLLERQMQVIIDAIFCRTSLLRAAPHLSSGDAVRVLLAFAEVAAARGAQYVAAPSGAGQHVLELLAPRVLPTLGSRTHAVLKWKATVRDARGAAARERPSAHRDVRSIATLSKLEAHVDRHLRVLDMLSIDELASIHRVVAWGVTGVGKRAAQERHQKQQQQQQQQREGAPRTADDASLRLLLKHLTHILFGRFEARRSSGKGDEPAAAMPLELACELAATAVAARHCGEPMLRCLLGELGAAAAAALQRCEQRSWHTPTTATPPLALLAIACEVLSEALAAARFGARGGGDTAEIARESLRVVATLVEHCVKLRFSGAAAAAAALQAEAERGGTHDAVRHLCSVRECLTSADVCDAALGDALDKALALARQAAKEQRGVGARPLQAAVSAVAQAN